MTTINIGTNKGNITGIKVDKPFKEISFSDIAEIVKGYYNGRARVIGWCNVSQSKEVKE
jgi:hypothetical protein